ncbi:MAG: hypothetical protein IH840_16560, partial [Candidatus Heimdallarchaeota archaeon]|nr:hypothetical protein [Candidatus Heimdallarchaeota archaeon]
NQFDLDLVEIISRTAIYLSQSFPRVKDSIDLANIILDVEKVRYQKTLDSGRKFVNQLIESKRKITDKTLVELYTSRGIPPETVKEVAKIAGMEVEIPFDFFLQVDKLKQDEVVAPQKIVEIDLDKIKHLETKLLYYDKNPKRTTEASVVEILDSGHLIVDQTIFYPTGGGQAEDLGWIYVGSHKIDITDVKKFGSAIVHKLATMPKELILGKKVKLEIDWERRLSLMRHHTAVHIVGGAARQVLGEHVWQAGADKTPDRGRLDITHWESISQETLDEIEYVANLVVMGNVRIKKHVMDRTEAEQKFGFKIYQGGVVPGKDLRIVEIPGIDVEACGGTHANQTGDLGYIRLTGSERIQDGIIRLTLTAGKQAVNRVQHEFQLLREAADAFSVNPEELPVTSARFFSEWKHQTKQINKLSKELAAAKVSDYIQKAQAITTNSGKTVRLIAFRLDVNQSDLLNLGEKFSERSEKEGDLISVILGHHDKKAMVIASRSKGSKYEISKIIRDVGKILGGGGGGKKDVVAGGGPNIAQLGSALKKVEEIVKNSL